jgi:hypothetical protein
MNAQETKQALQKLGELAKAMQGFAEGKPVQYRLAEGKKWSTVVSPTWTWFGDYRLKPEPKIVYINEYYNVRSVWDSEIEAREAAGQHVLRVAVKYAEVVE